MSVIKKIVMHIEKLERLITFCEIHPVMKEYDFSLHEMDCKAMYSIKGDYEVFLKIQKDVEDQSGMTLELITKWEHNGQKYFSFENDFVELWFVCDPDKIPKEVIND